MGKASFPLGRRYGGESRHRFFRRKLGSSFIGLVLKAFDAIFDQAILIICIFGEFLDEKNFDDLNQCPSHARSAFGNAVGFEEHWVASSHYIRALSRPNRAMYLVHA